MPMLQSSVFHLRAVGPEGASPLAIHFWCDRCLWGLLPNAYARAEVETFVNERVFVTASAPRSCEELRRSFDPVCRLANHRRSLRKQAVGGSPSTAAKCNVAYPGAFGDATCRDSSSISLRILTG